MCLRAGIYVCVYTGKGAPCLMTNLCVVILCVCAGIYVCVYTGKGVSDKLVCVNTLLAFMCVSILGRVPDV